MCSYKLIYFNVRGSGEMSRFILAQAGVTYEDNRVEYGGEESEWVKLKPNTPTGMLPILEVDGKQLVGSFVIARFLAERFGLAGSNDLENAEIAGILDVLKDAVTSMIQVAYCSEDRKAAMQKKFEEEDVPKYWGIIEGVCKENNSAEGWIYGAKPTYADLTIYCALDRLVSMIPNFYEQYPCVAKLKASVEALPNIAQWLKDRPKTEH